MNILALLAYVVSASVSDCSKGASLFKITSMSFSPDPPIPGQNSTLRLSMNVPTAVSGGTATYSPTYNFIPLNPSTDDLCTTLPSGCPIAVGQLDTISTFPVDSTLTGTLALNIQWKDLASNPLLCVDVKMKI